DVNILEYDASDLRFISKFQRSLFKSSKELVIIDECSMINDDLFDLIVEKVGPEAKIIFTGDAAQLKPVKQDRISKVFNNTDYPAVTLYKVMRQTENNPLLKTLVNLRKDVIYNFPTEIGEESGIVSLTEPLDFIKKIKENISVEQFIKDPFKFKALAYTRNRSMELNQLTR